MTGNSCCSRQSQIRTQCTLLTSRWNCNVHYLLLFSMPLNLSSRPAFVHNLIRLTVLHQDIVSARLSKQGWALGNLFWQSPFLLLPTIRMSLLHPFLHSLPHLSSLHGFHPPAQLSQITRVIYLSWKTRWLEWGGHRLVIDRPVCPRYGVWIYFSILLFLGLILHSYII